MWSSVLHPYTFILLLIFGGFKYELCELFDVVFTVPTDIIIHWKKNTFLVFRQETST